MQYEDFYRRSIEQPEAYWAEEAQRIHWDKPFTRTLDYSRAPFARWSSMAPPIFATTRWIAIWTSARIRRR